MDCFVKERVFPLDHGDIRGKFGHLGMFIGSCVEHGWNLNPAGPLRVSGGKVSLLGIKMMKGKIYFLSSVPPTACENKDL